MFLNCPCENNLNTCQPCVFRFYTMSLTQDRLWLDVIYRMRENNVIWRKALIVAVPKPEKPLGDPKSYLPIWRKPLNRAPSGIAKPALINGLLFYPMRTFRNKNRMSFTQVVHQYTYQYQGTVFHSRCEHCTQYCKKKSYCILAIFLL